MLAHALRKPISLAILIAILSLLLPASRLPAAAQQPPTASKQTSRSSSIMFIENVGQFADGARFQVRGGNGTMWLAEDALWITVMERGEAARPDRGPRAGLSATEPLAVPEKPRTGVNIRLSFPGANAHPRIEPFNRLDTVVSYFIGNDPDKWRPDVPVWGGVRYVDLYPGVDLEVASEGGQMVQRLAARPGVDLSTVQLRVEGANAVTMNGGDLRLSTAAGGFTLPLLKVDGLSFADSKVLQINTQAFNITTRFVPANSNSAYLDTSSQQSLIRKPQSIANNATDILYSTFLGGRSYEEGTDIAVDSAGNAYVTGITGYSDFPTTPGAFDTSFNGGDAFVVKLNPVGNGLAYSTFLGGNNGDISSAIVVDGVGNAYVTGYTSSTDFPTTPDAFDVSYNGGDYDAFVIKLDPAGSTLVYGTLLGGSSSDRAYGIAMDEASSVYMTGDTLSTDFPVTSDAFDMSFNGNPSYWDAFVVKLNPAGSGLIYSTYLGGNASDWGFAIAVDKVNSAYVIGDAFSSDFPTTPGAFSTGNRLTFVVKLNSAGSDLAYSTFLGDDSSSNEGCDIAVDWAGNAYVTASTSSGGFPTTPGAFDTSHNGGYFDAFVIKLNPAGSELTYATFLGGSSYDHGSGIAVDGAGNVYATGYTESADFPTMLDAFDTTQNGNYDAFVVKLDPTGSTLAYATFLGGSDGDLRLGIAVDEAANAYVTGTTYSNDFPITPGSFDINFSRGSDVFVTKLALGNKVTSDIAGHVTYVNDDPATSVLISNGAGHSVMTDGNGAYTLSGLTAGTFTLTPSKSGYTFFPASRTVTVPPDATGQDFVGTNQCASTTDTDGDGLLDGWEICGYDEDGDGTMDVNLPALGANPLRKDIFVEVDYMVQYGPCQAGACVAHSHQPKDDAIARIVQAFAGAPVSVSGGLPGIALHVDVSDAIPHQDTLQPTNETWNWSGFDRIKATNFDPRRERIFHYVVFAHDLGGDIASGTSGISRNDTSSDANFRRGASDFVVALGRWADGVGNINQQAGTFMHELGHNLGLRHGGDDHQNYEPNYLSIMNYSFQTDGLIVDDADGYFDYSRFGNISPLDEHHLNETIGLNGGTAIANYGTRYYCRQLEIWQNLRVTEANRAINWDCLLFAGGTDVQANINDGNRRNPDSTLSTLSSFDDWPALVYDGGDIGLDHSLAVVASAVEENVTFKELTFEIAAQFYRPYAVTLGGAGDIVASLGVTRTNVVTLTNAGALTATVALSYITGLGWFDLAAVPLTVTVAPSVSLSFPITLTAPGSLPAAAIADSVTISATLQEAPLMGDSATWRAHLGPLAQYSMEPAWGTRPLTVTFTDMSVGNITASVDHSFAL